MEAKFSIRQQSSLWKQNIPYDDNQVYGTKNFHKTTIKSMETEFFIRQQSKSMKTEFFVGQQSSL